MITTQRLTVAIAAASIALPTGLRAQESSGGSKHFAAVKQHLDFGGESLVYVDVDGDAQSLAEFADDVLAFAREAGAELPEEFDLSIADLVKTLGLDKVAAFGSSDKAADGRNISRSYLHLNGEPEGVFGLAGGEAVPFAVATLAPAGSDFVYEQKLDLRELTPLIDAVVRQIDQSRVSIEWLRMRDEPLPPPVGKPLAEVLGQMDSRVVLISRLHDTERWDIPGLPMEPPQVDLFLRVENIAWLGETLGKNFPERAITKGEGFWQAALGPMPPEDPLFEPVLHFDTETGHLSIASGSDFLGEVLSASGGLFAEAQFKKESAGLPEKGNSFSYISSQFGDELTKLYEVALSAEGNIPDRALTVLVGLARKVTPLLSGSFASASAVLPSGVLSVSNSREGEGGALAAASVTLVAVAASVSVPVLASVQDRAFQTKELQQLRQIHLCLQVHAADEGGEFPAQIGDERMIEEIGTDKIFKFPHPETGEIKSALYVSGLNHRVGQRDIVLASPWIHRGTRAVVFGDGSAAMVDAREFEAQLAQTLQRTGGKLNR